jgi:hypothetical protein
MGMPRVVLPRYVVDERMRFVIDNAVSLLSWSLRIASLRMVHPHCLLQGQRP